MQMTHHSYGRKQRGTKESRDESESGEWKSWLKTQHSWNEKTLAPWKKNYDKPKQHIKKQRYYLAAKVCLVKAMVFPVVMYGCKSWTIRKLSAEELMLLNCGVGEDSWESLGLQRDQTSQF